MEADFLTFDDALLPAAVLCACANLSAFSRSFAAVKKNYYTKRYRKVKSEKCPINVKDYDETSGFPDAVDATFFDPDFLRALRMMSSGLGPSNANILLS